MAFCVPTGNEEVVITREGAATTAVCAETAAVDATELDAVTIARIVNPASALERRYVELAAPDITAQFKPLVSQCSHSYEKPVGAALGFQLPFEVESVWPGTGVPEIAGRAVFCGGLPTVTASP